MEPVKLVYPVEGGDFIEAGEASSKMKMTLKKLGLPSDVNRKAAICMYEGEINMVIHANGGRAEVEVTLDQIVLKMIDEGPGIPDVAKAMEPMYTTAPDGERAGMGFSFMEAFMDPVEVVSAPGSGTTVTMRKKIGR